MNYKKVKHIVIKRGMKASDLVSEMNESGVMGAGKIGRAADIIDNMIKDKGCKVFFGLAGAMVPGGMKDIIIDILKNNYADVLVTTGANLTHDLIEALGNSHYQGDSNTDDVELNKQGIDRIYDVFMKNKVYANMEDFFEKIFDSLPKKMNIREFLFELGKYVKDENSILKVCYDKKIPIFCPGIADSGIGMMIWGNLAKGKKINIDVFDDLKEINEIVWNSEKIGVIYIGGGVPKNFIQQAVQFSEKGGASYGVQITMDRPEAGGSSGAYLKEGISWGKLNKDAKYINVICDATIALPLIYSYVKEKN